MLWQKKFNWRQTPQKLKCVKNAICAARSTGQHDPRQTQAPVMLGRPLRAALAAWCVAGAAPERVAYAPNASALAAALQGNGTVRVVLTGDVGCFDGTAPRACWTCRARR